MHPECSLFFSFTIDIIYNIPPWIMLLVIVEGLCESDQRFYICTVYVCI